MSNHTHQGSEDRPRDINPEEVGKTHPGKEYAAQKKVDIKQSGFGREQGQTPADEHIETSLSQESDENTYNEINDDDDRDHGDSTKDWDAEHSRTGRNK